MPNQLDLLTVDQAAADGAKDPAFKFKLGRRGIIYAINSKRLPARKLAPGKISSPWLIDPADWAIFKQTHDGTTGPKPKTKKRRTQAVKT